MYIVARGWQGGRKGVGRDKAFVIKKEICWAIVGAESFVRVRIHQEEGKKSPRRSHEGE